jgi:hypothetical protein
VVFFLQFFPQKSHIHFSVPSHVLCFLPSHPARFDHHNTQRAELAEKVLTLFFSSQIIFCIK